MHEVIHEHIPSRYGKSERLSRAVGQPVNRTNFALNDKWTSIEEELWIAFWQGSIAAQKRRRHNNSLDRIRQGTTSNTNEATGEEMFIHAEQYARDIRMK